MSLIKNEFPLLSPSIMKGVMRHQKCGFAYIKALPDRRSDMLSDIASGAVNSALSVVRLLFFFLKNAKPRKKTGAFTQRIEEIGESYGDEHSS